VLLVGACFPTDDKRSAVGRRHPAVNTARHSRNPKTRFSLPIADFRLTIEKVVWQLLPMSIGNRKSAIPDILGQTTIPEILRKTRRQTTQLGLRAS